MKKNLTQKQEKFCLEYIKCGNASEAYRRAYDAKNMKSETINRNAKELIDSNKIATRIESLRKPAVEKAMMTLEGHLERLEELSKQAAKAKQFGPAVAAETARGKASGVAKPAKLEMSGAIDLGIDSMSDEELERIARGGS